MALLKNTVVTAALCPAVDGTVDQRENLGQRLSASWRRSHIWNVLQLLCHGLLHIAHVLSESFPVEPFTIHIHLVPHRDLWHIVLLSPLTQKAQVVQFEYSVFKGSVHPNYKAQFLLYCASVGISPGRLFWLYLARLWDFYLKRSGLEMKGTELAVLMALKNDSTKIKQELLFPQTDSKLVWIRTF